MALPSKKEYQIKISLGGHDFMIDPLPQKNPSYYKRYGRMKAQVIEAPYVDVLDFGKIIISLMDDKDPICYYKTNVRNYQF